MGNYTNTATKFFFLKKSISQIVVAAVSVPHTYESLKETP